MKPLYDAVARHLRSQRGAENALKLWDDLWNSFEKGGVETLASDLEERYVLPEDPDDGDEGGADDDSAEEAR